MSNQEILAFLAVATTASLIAFWLYEEPNHNGCIASASQASRFGFDYEENLKECYKK